RPVVPISLAARGPAITQRVTGGKVGRRMAVVYIEIVSEPKRDASGEPVVDAQGEIVRETRRIEEVITAPVIRQQLGKRLRIEGIGSVREANELALLLRAGAVAAPVEFPAAGMAVPRRRSCNYWRGV